MARMINRMIGWLGLALVGLACGRPLAHPCRNGVECAVGWSCVDQLCQPDSPRDGAADQMSAADHSNHDDAHDAKQDQADKGDSTTLDGTPDAPADLAGDRVSDARPSGDRGSPWNYVFVTSEMISTTFGSLDAADLFCNKAAASAGLPGTFRAWLSTTQIDARDRLTGARGWVRPDGLPFADTADDVAMGHMFYPAVVDENVLEHRGNLDEALTGTNVDGRLAPGFNCSDWAGQPGQGNAIHGFIEATTDLWTTAGWADCTPARLYCFGIDKIAPLAPVAASGKRAFLSDDYFVSGVGIDGADELCAREATAAGLTGQFKALLATPSASAASRFTSPPETVWVRLDGVPLNAPGVDLFGSTPPLAPLNVTSRMKYLGNDGVYVGAATPRSVGTLATTCADWQIFSSSQMAVMVRASVSALSASPFFGPNTGECIQGTAHVYCLED